jgi:hypothetical protein
VKRKAVQKKKGRAVKIRQCRSIGIEVVSECVIAPVVVNKPINTVDMDSLVGQIGELTLALTSDEVARVHETAQTAQAFGPILNTSKDNNGVVTHSPPLTPSAVMGVLREALTASAVSFCTRAAQAWAGGFTFPKEARENDAKLLGLCEGDFHALWAAKRALGAANRLSEERVKESVKLEFLKDRKDYGRLMAIARGIEIETEPGLIPSGHAGRPQMRQKYTRDVPNAVNNLIHKQWVESTVVLLPTELLEDRGYIIRPFTSAGRLARPRGAYSETLRTGKRDAPAQWKRQRGQEVYTQAHVETLGHDQTPHTH